MKTFIVHYEQHRLAGMRAKFGLQTERPSDPDLVQEFLDAMHAKNVDFTSAFRRLTDAAEGQPESLRALFAGDASIDRWLKAWNERLTDESGRASVRADAMRRVNPVFIPRNHRVEEALDAAVDDGDFAPFHKLCGILQHPFEDQPEHAVFAEPAPLGSPPHQTFCGT